MFRLKLLGGVGLEGDAGPLTGPVAQRQRLATLAFLSTSPRGVSREKVLATLWPDVEPERARRSLSNVLYAIRTALGDEAVVGAGDELHLDMDGPTSSRRLDQR